MSMSKLTCLLVMPLLAGVILATVGCGGGSATASEQDVVGSEPITYERFDKAGYAGADVSTASLTGTWVFVGEENITVDVSFFGLTDVRSKSLRSTVSIVDNLDGTATVADCFSGELLSRLVSINNTDQSFSFLSGSLETVVHITNNAEFQVARNQNGINVVESRSDVVAYKITDDTFQLDSTLSRLGSVAIIGTENGSQMINKTANLACFSDERHTVERTEGSSVTNYVIDKISGTAFGDDGKKLQFDVIHPVNGIEDPELDVFYEGIWGDFALHLEEFKAESFSFSGNTELFSSTAIEWTSTAIEWRSKSTELNVSVDLSVFL